MFVLVDRQNLERLSTSIDAITIRPRINFRAVTLHPHANFQGHPDYMSGKLAFKDSPFSHWMQDRVTDQNTDHLCVPTAAGLRNGTEPRVTPSGQTRNGDKGAHGEFRDGNIIGFSNERRLAELTSSIDATTEELSQVRAHVKPSLAGAGRAHEDKQPRGPQSARGVPAPVSTRLRSNRQSVA